MNKKIGVLVSMALFFIVVVSASIGRQLLPKKERPIVKPQTIQQLAFDYDKRLGFTVYLEEEGVLEPYYVVTKDYFSQGNTLLLRKYVWEDYMWHQEENFTSYYAQSIPDRFMNAEFIHKLSKVLQEIIPVTTFPIAPTRGEDERAAEWIKRRIFLLSPYELGNRHGRYGELEERLDFFVEDSFVYRLATLPDGTPASWWLRNVARTEYVLAGYMSYEGKFGLGWIVTPSYVRPAFTLPPETKITQTEHHGEAVYVLDLSEEDNE